MKKISLYKKLVLTYILFSLLLLVVLAVSLFGIALVQSQGRLDGVYPYQIKSTGACEKYQSGIEGLNGWVEKLDENYQVMEVYGEKYTEAQGYDPYQLFLLTSGDKNSSLEYVGFMNHSEDHAGYYLVQYHRSDVEINTTMMYSSANSNPLWNKLFLAVFLILFAGICLLMANYLSRRIKRPLKSLSSAMSRVKAGEETVELDFKAEAEFAEIRDAFNIMSRTLAQARREKNEAEARKNKMMLELSHDIRTPISTINSFAVALEQNMVQEEDKQKIYKTIHMKAVRVSNLADDMFTMLKMRSDEYYLQKSCEDICEFLRRQCAEHYQDAFEKGLGMDIDIPETEIFYEADYTLFARAVSNLLDNAVKYNHTGEKIEVRLKKTGRLILISIADDGVPIAEAVRGRLFDDFTRGDSARRSDGGTGVGLSIAKAIVEKHDGKIGYEYRDGDNIFSIELYIKGKLN